MKEIHGVADARKISMCGNERQAVEVEDGNGEIILRLGACSYPAGLTPEQARAIAANLIAAADRIVRPVAASKSKSQGL